METGRNLDISNGTCYYDPWEASSSNIIPCGNAVSGVYACCQAGDVCLDENACYNAARCTDPNFTDTSCPQKDISNQQLLGLVQCEGADATSTTGTATTVLWSGCPGPTSRTTLGAPSACACTGTADGGLIWMTSSLAGVATLPASLGGEIVWAQVPTATTASSPALESDGTASRGGLSGGAKAGISAGVVALLFMPLIGLCWWISVRRRRRPHPNGPRLQTRDPGREVGLSSQATAVSEGDNLWNGRTDGSFTGYKVELSAEPRWVSRVELPGDDVCSANSKRTAAYGVSREQHASSVVGAVLGGLAPDDRASVAVSEVSSVHTVSRMGSLHTPGVTPTLDSIAEMHGR